MSRRKKIDKPLAAYESSNGVSVDLFCTVIDWLCKNYGSINCGGYIEDIRTDLTHIENTYRAAVTNEFHKQSAAS